MGSDQGICFLAWDVFWIPVTRHAGNAVGTDRVWRLEIRRDTMIKDENDGKVMRAFAKQYKNVAAASTEIINLQSIMNLPKGTEHFLTDIHGESEQFNQIGRAHV